MADSVVEDYRVQQTNEAGEVTVIVGTRNAKGRARTDTILPVAKGDGLRRLIDIFLPAGFPGSVTEDYVDYQIYDSIQAFVSTIANLLASRAVLEGIGVGDASASTTAAVIYSVVQDTLGRFTTIVFAHRFGTSFEPECKMYRLLADVFNDIAIVLECLSPAMPKPMRVATLAASNALKALCGVAGGSTKASLSQHFARDGNIGELNAVSIDILKLSRSHISQHAIDDIQKDASQETVIGLAGIWIGSLIISQVTSRSSTWSLLIVLLSMHLAFNYRAVRSVALRTLNRQRAGIVISTWMASGKALTPKEVATRELVFERDGAIRDANDDMVGSCEIGVSFQTLLKELNVSHGSQSDAICRDLLQLYDTSGTPYVLWADTLRRRAWIVLKEDCTPSAQLKAWFLAYCALKDDSGVTTQTDAVGLLRALQPGVDETFVKLEQALIAAGWATDTPALETQRRGTRVAISLATR